MLQFEISWGVITDLDNHLKIFDDNGNEICHIYHKNRNCLGASLDVDIIEVR